MKKFPYLPDGFTITAHTGCEGSEYNSAESIRVGAQYGDIIEVDLNFTKTGDPVLAHTFAKKGSLPLDEAFSVLASLPDLKMNIDVKIGSNLTSVYDLAVKHGVQNRIFYTGIGGKKLIAAKRDTPKIPLYNNETVTRLKMLKKGYIDHLISDTKKQGAIGLNTSYKACTRELIDAFHKENLLVSLYTCNDEKAILKALYLGADNITTKSPKLLRRLISPLPDTFRYTAHTGCSGTKDNSLESIKAGIEHGAGIVEFDLNFDKNNSPVLSHDDPKGNEVPLQKAFLLLSQHTDVQANVDVKKTANLKAVFDMAQKCGVQDRIFYTGIQEKDVPAVKKDSPEISYYLNVDDVLPSKKHTREYLLGLTKKVKECGAVGINMNYKNASLLLVDVFHKEGLKVSLWTVNDEKDLYRILSYSPDNITTRKPELLKAILKK